MEVFSPHFDRNTSWYRDGLMYQDLYAIYKDDSLASQHPEWILKDASGNRLFIPWGCGGGTCPQYAGDISNPDFRHWWIDEAKRKLATGYKGLWVDDVNMEFRVSNGSGTQVAPIDRNTGAPMTWDNWRRYIAEFTEQIRRETTGYEILHNSIWYAGPSGVRDADPYIRRQISSADVINLEHGVNDPGLTGGTGIWSLRAVHAFVDRVHALGKAVVIDDFGNSTGEKEYALANYLLINEQADAIGNMSVTPDNWWPGYSVNLGNPLGQRQTWNNLIRRDFQGGMVLVNEPEAPTRTVTLPGTYRTVAGSPVTSVTLPAKAGIVLIGQSSETTAPVIQGITALPAATSASISWTTDELADSRVDYGPGSCCSLSGPVSSAMTRTHVVTLSSLTPGTSYSYRVSSRDASGNSAVSGIVTFSTLPLADATPPRVIAALPSGSTTPANSTLEAQFSELVSPATTTGSTVYLVRFGGATPVPATLSYDSAARSVKLRPATALQASAKYNMVVKGGTSGVKDLAGNPMPADFVKTFTATGAPSSVTNYLSDLPYVVINNGWGPVEKDKSNAEAAAGDGRTITLNGSIYTKGLGVHAGSAIRYEMAGTCTNFLTHIGVDDEVGGYGSVVFQVRVDGVKVYDSGIMRGTTATKGFNLSVAGKNLLELIVTDAGDDPNSDHADWAGARLICSQ